MNTYDEPDNEPNDPLEELARASEPTYRSPIHTQDEAITWEPEQQDTRLQIGVACAYCGYNLYGQRTYGTCPECGNPVAHSLRKDHLITADQGWLSAMKTGVLWLLIGTFSNIGLSMLAGGVSAVSQSAAAPNFNQQPTSPFAPGFTPMPAVIATIFATAIASSMLIYGYLQLTSPEPPPSKDRTSRNIARWTLPTGYALTIFATLITIVQTEAVLLMSLFLQVLSALLVVAGTVAVMIYMRHLALRAQDRGLARQTSIVLWGNVISWSMIVLGGIIILVAIASGQASPAGLILGALCVCPSAIAILVFAIWWIVLLFFYHARFTKSLARARDFS